MTAPPATQEDLIALINQIVDTRTSPSPQAEKCRGLVDQVQSAPVFTFSAFIDGASAATPGIPYPAGNPPVSGATVTLERRREDGFIQLTGVDAIFAVDTSAPPPDLSGLVTDQELADHAADDSHIHTYITPSTQDTDAGHWSMIGYGVLDNQFDQVVGTVLFDGNGGATSAFTRGILRFRVKQQAAFGSNPVVLCELKLPADLALADVVLVVTSNVGPTTYEIYVRMTRAREWLIFQPLLTNMQGCIHTWAGCSPFVSSLPPGTQFVASA